MNSLLTAVLDERSRVRVVITLRADFIDRPLQYVDFGELVRQRTEFVLPLTPDEMEQAIVGPAEHAGLTLEAGLIAAIVRDVGDQPGTLPLLQYALTELFERRDGRALTLAAYQESGGVLGALTRRAEEIYTKLDSAGQEAARQLFLRLVTLGEGVEDTRRRVRRAELESVVGGPLSVVHLQQTTDHRPRTTDKVIDAYGRYRLLTFDRDPITRGPTVEVAHEALIRSWGRLRGWLDASRENLRVQQRLATAAAEWATAGGDPSFLASGARLSQFAALAEASDLALNEEERSYLDASLAERDRQARADVQSRAAAQLRRRAVLLAGVLVLALIAALIAGVFANNNATLANNNATLARTNADSAATAQAAGDQASDGRATAVTEAQLRATQQAVAEANFSNAQRQRLALEAKSVLDQTRNGELAALLALRSLRIAYSPAADGALLRAEEYGFARRIFSGHTDSVNSVAFSPDGRSILTCGADAIARLWDATTGQELRQFTGHVPGICHVVFAPDGRAALTTSDGRYAPTTSADTTARLWDVATGQELHTFPGHRGGAAIAVFSPDGRYVATGSIDNTARLWDAQTGQELRQFIGHTDAVFGLAFTPDGRQILTSSVDGTARLWRTDLQDVIQLACAQLRRDLTDDERKQYTITDNSPTCPKT